jgi:ATP-dependent DNA helicase RecG
VVWFNQPWVGERAQQLRELSLYGPLRRARNGQLQLVNPEINDVEGGGEGIVPVYRSLGPLSGRRLRLLIARCLPVVGELEDPLPAALRPELGLPELGEALRRLHAPEVPSSEERRRALVASLNGHGTPDHCRLAFDELLCFLLGLAEHRARRAAETAPGCPSSGAIHEIAASALPFELTAAQRRVVGEIAADLPGPVPMARLLQGDVGSGKTVVAALAMAMAVENGYQAALMAPTELLAEQHARTLEGFFARIGRTLGLLSASVPAAEQRRIRQQLEDGSLRIVVGTHALIQDAVRFQRLALAVVDEQQRFGVAHRRALVAKGPSPHLLVMTATPIPRSLALTVYGDLELSIIDELPPGRRPVRTVVRPTTAKPRLYAFLRRELAAGGRCYLVYPMIEPSDELEAPALEEHVAEVRRELEDFEVGVLHGRMTRAEREEVSDGFADGRLQALLATTVVEVGIDVPQATVMVVEGADRFGLSQLHQLRGRVGRGPRPSWCALLVDDTVGLDARLRLEVLCRTTDGFEIAEADLELRGSGELTGTRQWGPTELRFADLIRHRGLIGAVRDSFRRLEVGGDLPRVRQALSRYHRFPPETGGG